MPEEDQLLSTHALQYDASRRVEEEPRLRRLSRSKRTPHFCPLHIRLVTLAYPSRKHNVNLTLLEVAQGKPNSFQAPERGFTKLLPELEPVERPGGGGGRCRRGHKSTATPYFAPLPFTAIPRKAWVSQEDWSTSPRSIPPSEIPSGVVKAAHPSANTINHARTITR